MIVYLLVHLPSEMSYVGSTSTSADKRFKKHWKDRKKSSSPLYEAMRASSKDDWLIVTLEELDTLEETLREENWWMFYLETLRSRVGFNEQIVTENEIRARVNGDFDPVTQQQQQRAWTEEEVESFREAGRRGAELSKFSRSAEQRSIDGKRGAEAYKRKLDADPRARARASEVGKKNGSAWWAKLTPEQQEAHKEDARVAGRNNTKK